MPATIDFSHISNPLLRRFLQHLEDLRKNGEIEQAAYECKIFHSYIMQALRGGGALVTAFVGAYTAYMMAADTPEADAKAAQGSETLNNLIAAVGATALSTAATMALNSTMKETSTYLCFLCTEYDEYRGQEYWKNHRRYTQEDYDKLNADSKKYDAKKMYRSAISYGFTSTDSLLLWLSLEHGDFEFGNDSATTSKIINTGVNLDYYITSIVNGDVSIIWQIAQLSFFYGWGEFVKIYDKHPHLDLTIYPKLGRWSGYTILNLAAISAPIEVVQKLIEKSASVFDVVIEGGGNSTTTQLNVGKSALWFLAKREAWDLVSLMIEKGANINIMPAVGEDAGISVLHLAAVKEEWELVAKLIDLGAIVENEATQELLVKKAPIDIIKTLVNKNIIKKAQIEAYVMQDKKHIPVLESLIHATNFDVATSIYGDPEGQISEIFDTIKKAMDKTSDNRLELLSLLGFQDKAVELIKASISKTKSSNLIIKELFDNWDPATIKKYFDEHVPSDEYLYCRSSYQKLLDPVKLKGDEEGVYYERASISQWIAGKNPVNPLTSKPITVADIEEVHDLSHILSALREKMKSLQDNKPNPRNVRKLKN